MSERPDLETLKADLSVEGGIRPGQTRTISGYWRQQLLDLCDYAESLERDLMATRAWTREHADHLLRCKAVGGRWGRDGVWHPPEGPCTCGRDGPAALARGGVQ